MGRRSQRLGRQDGLRWDSPTDMPHVTLDISANLGDLADGLLDSVIGACQGSGGFDAAVIMGRAVVHDRFRVLQQGASAFVAATLRIRPGRDDGFVAGLSARIAGEIERVLALRGVRLRTCVTCEIAEIDLRTRALILFGDP